MTATVLYLQDLRPDPFVERDLRWYYNCADGEMGLRSNYLPMVQQAMEGPKRGTVSCAPPDGFDGHLVAAAQRARFIRRALQRLSRGHQDTLRDAYLEQLLEDAIGRDEQGRSALQQLEAYGALAGLVGLSPTARQEHAGSKTKRPLGEWLERLARPSAGAKPRTICAALRREAEARLAAASKAYVQAAKEFRQQTRSRAEYLAIEDVDHG